MAITEAQVYRQMEKQMARMKEAIANHHADQVRECAAIIEGYCQLLKENGPEQQKRSEIRTAAQPIQPAAYTHEVDNEKPQRNLLDF